MFGYSKEAVRVKVKVCIVLYLLKNITEIVYKKGLCYYAFIYVELLLRSLIINTVVEILLFLLIWILFAILIFKIFQQKCEGKLQPELRKFSVDPQITSLEVLQSILIKAFDIKSAFTLSFRTIDDYGQEIYLPLLSDWDLDAAFLKWVIFFCIINAFLKNVFTTLCL